MKQKAIRLIAFLNNDYFSSESPLNEGDFFLKVSYEGKDLYENEWDFCTMEDDEDEDERFVFCPYEAKPYNWIIPKKIPNYLPKVTIRVVSV